MLGLDLPDELPETVSAVLCCAMLYLLSDTMSVPVCAAVSLLCVYSMWCDISASM